MPKTILRQYEGDYMSLPAGTSGLWKYVSRLNMDEAVCIISRIKNDNHNCRAILSTKSSSNKSIVSHALSVHKLDIKDEEKKKEEQMSNQMKKYLTEKKFNDIWTLEYVYCYLIAKKGVSLSFFKDNLVINNLLKIAFRKELPSLYMIKKGLQEHAKAVKEIIKRQLNSEKTLSFSFDEWTSPSNVQVINLIVHTNTITSI